MSSYSLSLPFESRHFRNEMDASTFAGEYVFGSFKSEIILSRIVLKHKQSNDIEEFTNNVKIMCCKFIYMLNKCRITGKIIIFRNFLCCIVNHSNVSVVYSRKLTCS